MMMTDEELNEKIAVILGWEVYEPICGEKHWLNKATGGAWFGAPDYCNSWELAGQLIEDLYSKNYHINLRIRNKSNVDTEIFRGHYDNDRCEVTISIVSGVYGEYTRFTADTPTRAIAEAWFDTNKALLEGE